MARYLLGVLACLAAAELVCSLQCYVCLTPTPGNECVALRNCTHLEKWCSTTIYGPSMSGYPFNGARTVIRSCVEECQPSNPNTLGVTRQTFCCQESRCNARSSAQRMTTGNSPITAILLAVCFALKVR